MEAQKVTEVNIEDLDSGDVEDINYLKEKIRDLNREIETALINTSNSNNLSDLAEGAFLFLFGNADGHNPEKSMKNNERKEDNIVRNKIKDLMKQYSVIEEYNREIFKVDLERLLEDLKDALEYILYKVKD
jgi:hypothetical protein